MEFVKQHPFNFFKFIYWLHQGKTTAKENLAREAKEKQSSHGELNHVEKFKTRNVNKLCSALNLIRPQQWAKNMLVFAPLVLAHKAGETDLLLQASLAFISFSLMASSVYILNDFLDVGSDRQHPIKRKRPIANGEISLPLAGFMFFALLMSSLGISFSISPNVAFILLGYFCVNLLYSFFLKRVILLDVFILTSFYISRVMAGGHAVEVEISYWLVSFSFFIFLSLAFLKRFAELKVLFKHYGRKMTLGRGYHFDDMPVLMGFGVVTGMASVLILALYIQLGNHFQLYSNPKLLWGIEALVLYWICLFWIRASRGIIEDDPVKFAITDKTSWLVAAFVATLGVLAS